MRFAAADSEERHCDAENTESSEYKEYDAARAQIAFHIGVDVGSLNLGSRLGIVHIRETVRTNQGLVGDLFGYTEARGAVRTSGDTAHADTFSSTATGDPYTSRRHWRTN